MTEKISQIIHQLYGLDIKVTLTRPDVRFGDYATNIALQLGGRLDKAPREIAEQLAERLRETGDYEEVAVAGPGFINLRVAGQKLAETLEIAWSMRYGENADGRGKTVIVEYPSPNMAKPYSVGHLRPGTQGWAAKRLMEATGWKVISDNHLGDYGTPLGIWIVGFLNFSSPEQLEKGGVYELGRVYIQTKRALADEKARGESALASEVQSWLLRLENGDPQAARFSRQFNRISLDHIHAVMVRLNISTDYELGEAFFAPKGKQAVQKLLERGVAAQNADGSVIVNLDDYGFDVPLLIQKSNGAALYATTDLATILYRQETWQPDRVIYAVGAEQQFYFSQLFALAKKIGIQTELIHLWFGMIDQKTESGARQKMSSRKGVVLVEELLDQAEAKARQLIEGRQVSDEDVKKIAVGAIKFSDFTADRRTNILFDWDTIFALGGFSGPFVQYAAVRVNKILHDHAATRPAFVPGYSYESEKPLIMKLLDYPAVILLAARDLEPHKIAAYLYELARDLNRYYEATPIATKEVAPAEKQARLDMLAKVSHVFAHGLSLLGIDVPSQM